MKPKGKRPSLLKRNLEPSEIVESLCQDETLERIKKGKDTLFKFKDRRRLYSIDELLHLLEPESCCN